VLGNRFNPCIDGNSVSSRASTSRHADVFTFSEENAVFASESLDNTFTDSMADAYSTVNIVS